MSPVLQGRVAAWVVRCFGARALADEHTRALRLLEEAAEFAQAVGVSREKLDLVLDIVFSRPPGDPSQELGGVAVTALAAAEAVGTCLHSSLVAELTRIERVPVEHFQKRNAEKVQP